jgi:hypothetical protein
MANEPQKSEVHEATADAGTNPTAGRDPEATRRTQATGHEDRAWRDGPGPLNPAPPTDARIVEDQTDDGGPLVVESGDPDLNPPRAPVDPFPTLGTPEIDLPVKRGE